MTTRWIFLTFIILALAACGANSSGDRSNAPSPSVPDAVNMSATAFVPESTTIEVGDSLTLVADGVVPHFIANGSWRNGNAAPERETGAPAADNIQIQGGERGTIGPFTTAGSYAYYCTIHPGMNLTVNVE